VGEGGGPGNGTFFHVPEGWTEERINGGTSWNGLGHPRTKSGDAKVVVVSLGGKVSQPQIDVWTRFLKVTDFKYEGSRGEGKMGGEDAEIAYAVVEKRGGSVLVIGALKKSAPPERRHELVACMERIE
jgi:hypothetical protein